MYCQATYLLYYTFFWQICSYSHTFCSSSFSWCVFVCMCELDCVGGFKGLYCQLSCFKMCLLQHRQCSLSRTTLKTNHITYCVVHLCLYSRDALTKPTPQCVDTKARCWTLSGAPTMIRSSPAALRTAQWWYVSPHPSHLNPDGAIWEKNSTHSWANKWQTSACFYCERPGCCNTGMGADLTLWIRLGSNMCCRNQSWGMI